MTNITAENEAERVSDKEYIRTLQNEITRLAKFIKTHYPAESQEKGPVEAAMRLLDRKGEEAKQHKYT